MLIDLHVHTNRFSPCAAASPEEMVGAAISQGLDGIVITEHDYLWNCQEISDLQSRFPAIKIFRGVEVSITLDEHMLVVGVSDMSRFKLCMSAHNLRDAVREAGGACILAHPYRWSSSIHPDIMAAGFDGVEGYSTNVANYMREAVDKLVRIKKVPVVATTDSHTPSTLGLYAIRLDRPVHDEHQLARVIRQGQFGLYCNGERLAVINQEMEAKLAIYRSLKAKGFPSEDALARAGISIWQNNAVAKGLDMGLAIPELDRDLSEEKV